MRSSRTSVRGGAPLALVLRCARLEATQRSRQPLRGARCGIAAAVGLLLLLLPVLLLLRLCSRRRRVLEEQASHLREEECGRKSADVRALALRRDALESPLGDHGPRPSVLAEGLPHENVRLWPKSFKFVLRGSAPRPRLVMQTHQPETRNPKTQRQSGRNPKPRPPRKSETRNPNPGETPSGGDWRNPSRTFSQRKNSFLSALTERVPPATPC